MSLQIPENAPFSSSNPCFLLFGPASISPEGVIELTPQTYRFEQVTNPDGSRSLRLMKRIDVNGTPSDVLCA